MLLLNHHIFVKSNKNKVFLIYCSSSSFFFLKENKLKRFAVALKLLTVSSLNSNVFC